MTRKKLDVGHISKETKRFRNISVQEKRKREGALVLPSHGSEDIGEEEKDNI